MEIFILAGVGFTISFCIVFLIGSIGSIRTIRKPKRKNDDEIFELEFEFELESDVRDGEIVNLIVDWDDYLSKPKRKMKNDGEHLDSRWNYK